MAFNKKHKAAIKAIVSCHETGKPVANYGALVVLKDDAGITYGAHQATHKAGSLYKIVKLYCDVSNSPTSEALVPYLTGLKRPEVRHKYAADAALKKLLKQAALEPEMQYAQHKVFESHYFEPALRAVQAAGWVHPLSLAIVYDSMIHGGWLTLKGRVSAATEKDWMKKYVAVRRKWLASSSRPIVRKTTYRMKTFEDLFKADNWNLELPISVNGIKINSTHLAYWMTGDSVNESKAEETVQSIESPDQLEELYAGNTENMADEPEGQPVAAPEVPAVEAVVVENAPVETAQIPAQTPEMSAAAPPVEIEKVQPEKPSGWSTWTTTVSATLGSLGLSVTSFFSWWGGALQDPTSKDFVIALTFAGIGIAAIFGLFYLVNRAVTNYRNEKFAHQLELKELEIRSRPDRYNVIVAKKR